MGRALEAVSRATDRSLPYLKQFPPAGLISERIIETTAIPSSTKPTPEPMRIRFGTRYDTNGFDALRGEPTSPEDSEDSEAPFQSFSSSSTRSAQTNRTWRQQARMARMAMTSVHTFAAASWEHAACSSASHGPFRER